MDFFQTDEKLFFSEGKSCSAYHLPFTTVQITAVYENGRKAAKAAAAPKTGKGENAFGSFYFLFFVAFTYTAKAAQQLNV